MALIDDYLVSEEQHSTGMEMVTAGIRLEPGVQRIYRFPNGMGLSLVSNLTRGMLGLTLPDFMDYQWEIAVLENVSEDGKRSKLCYSSSLDDVQKFQDDEGANEFIKKAIKLFVVDKQESMKNNIGEDMARWVDTNLDVKN